MSRREQIEAMLADDPQDQFLRYSLAMELQKEDRDQESLDLLQGLMSEEPPHVPAYLMAGQLLQRLGREEEARQVLHSGAAEAARQGNDHAAAEMTELLASLG